MKKTYLILLLFLPASLESQMFYNATFGTGTSFPVGWSSTDSRITVINNTASSGYTSSATSPNASGGSNVIFQQCSPNTTTPLVLNCAGVISTIGKTNIRVGFGRRKTAAFDRTVAFEYSTDGSNWNSIDADVTLGSSTTWSSTFYDIPSDAEGQPNLRFRFSYVSDVTNNCVAAPNFRIDDFTVGENATLPIKLVRFEAMPNRGNTLLAWRTATETNNAHFSIERGVDGRQFFEIGQVKGAGTSFEPLDYFFTDERPSPGINYYRLRQVDFDGQFSYSQVVTTTVGKAGGVLLMPTPATDFLTVRLEKPTAETTLWEVFDQAGRQVLSGEFPAESADFEINVADLPTGIYALRLIAGQEAFVRQFQKKGI